jgi:hypothetical protein
MMFCYGPPRLLGRMVAEPDLAVIYDGVIDDRMASPSSATVETGILGGHLPTCTPRLDSEQQRDVLFPAAV